MYSTLIYLIFMVLVFVQCYRDCPANSEHETLEEGRLYRRLQCAQDSDYRPVKDHKSSVNVQVKFTLKYMNFDSEEELFTVHSEVGFAWKNEFLTWNPSDYGDIKEIQVESNTIWTPRLAHINADAAAYQTDSFDTTCLVVSDGLVTCTPYLAYSGICRTTLRNWPFDTQKCILYFSTWLHTVEEVNFTFHRTKPIVLDGYQDGPGWKLLNLSYDRTSNSLYPMLKYTFKLERESSGHEAIVVVPTVVIFILTLTCLLLDIKGNTRLMLACFSLFGHYIYLSQIGYFIPKHNSDTSIILLFVRNSMIITLLVVLVTLVLMDLRRRAAPAYTWIITLNRLMSNGPGKYVIFTEFDPCDITENKIMTEDTSTSHSNGDRFNILTEWIQFCNFLNSLVCIIIFIVYIVLFCTYIPGKR